MKVILYMATSINGYITRGADDSDWVSDVDLEQFTKLMTDSGIMIMGGRTYEKYSDFWPQKGALNVVMTHNRELLEKKVEGLLFTDKTPKEIVDYAEENDFSQLMLIGGMVINTSFIREKLVDEIWIDIHPLLIGEGKTIFEKLDLFEKVKLAEVKQLGEDQVLLKYKLQNN